MSIQSALSMAGQLFSKPVNLGKEVHKRLNIAMGYGETHDPYVPRILDKTADFKIITGNALEVAVTLGAEGTEPGSKESLDMIYSATQALTIAQKIEKFPTNTLAVSIRMKNFRFLNNCHAFALSEEMVNIKGFFTYKRLSINLQAVYFYDENRNQFLAGFVYYLTPAGNGVLSSVVDKDLIYTEILKQEPFPLKNRAFNPFFIRYKYYGRYCSLAKDRVLLGISEYSFKMVHLDYCPFRRVYNEKECVECNEDFKNYRLEKTEKDQQENPEREIKTISGTINKRLGTAGEAENVREHILQPRALVNIYDDDDEDMKTQDNAEAAPLL